MQVSRRQAHRVTGPSTDAGSASSTRRCSSTISSEGGCFVNSLYDTPVGQRISLRLTLPYEGTVTVHAETVYGRPGFGFAVRFVDVSDET